MVLYLLSTFSFHSFVEEEDLEPNHANIVHVYTWYSDSTTQSLIHCITRLHYTHTMNETLSQPKNESLAPLETVIWFNEYTTLRRVSPHVATNSDTWVVTDSTIEHNDDENDDNPKTPIVGVALIEPGFSDEADATVHRIGVMEDYRRNGIATALIDTAHEEYGSLELECRTSLAANEFYEATGWEHVGVKQGTPEDLNQWRRTPEANRE